MAMTNPKVERLLRKCSNNVGVMFIVAKSQNWKHANLSGSGKQILPDRWCNGRVCIWLINWHGIETHPVVKMNTSIGNAGLQRCSRSGAPHSERQRYPLQGKCWWSPSSNMNIGITIISCLLEAKVKRSNNLQVRCGTALVAKAIKFSLYIWLFRSSGVVHIWLFWWHGFKNHRVNPVIDMVTPTS